MKMGYLQTLQIQMGIPIWLIITILVWSFAWKLIALWKSARKSQIAWFIVLALVNTVGILEILYVYIFSEMKFSSPKKKTSKKKISKKK